MSDKKRLYVWLDILGFSEEVKQNIDNIDNSKSGELPRILTDFQEGFVENIREKIIVEKEPRPKDGRMFSDGIILDFGEVSSFSADNLKDIFKKVGEEQFKFMLEHKKLIRGGIAVGKTLEEIKKSESQDGNKRTQTHNIIETQEQEKLVKKDESREEKEKQKKALDSEKFKPYISSGLVRAYEIETTKIHWPIIGTITEQINEIYDALKTPDQGEAFFGLKKTFNKNGEEIYFIDFFSNAKDNIDDFKSKLEEITSENCQNIEMKNKVKVIDKYIWLYRYYNTLYGECVFHPLFKIFWSDS